MSGNNKAMMKGGGGKVVEHGEEEEIYGSQQPPNNNDKKEKVPRAIKNTNQWPASYSVQDFPWDRIQVSDAKKNAKQKMSYFAGFKIDGAPWGFKLRCHMLKVSSPFGFSPPMEGSTNMQKWSYSVTLDPAPMLASFAKGDEFMKPQLMRAFGDQKLKLQEYIPMAKEARASQNGTVYPPALKLQVQLDDNEEPKDARLIKDKTVLEKCEWKTYQRHPHTADVLMELRSAWYASGKYGLKWVLIRLRPYDTAVQDAKFPDELDEQNEADDEDPESTNTTNSKDDKKETASAPPTKVDETSDDEAKNRKRKRDPVPPSNKAPKQQESPDEA